MTKSKNFTANKTNLNSFAIEICQTFKEKIINIILNLHELFQRIRKKTTLTHFKRII